MWEGFFFTSASVHIYKLLPCESTQEFVERGKGKKKKRKKIEVNTHDHVSTGGEGPSLKQAHCMREDGLPICGLKVNI